MFWELTVLLIFVAGIVCFFIGYNCRNDEIKHLRKSLTNMSAQRTVDKGTIKHLMFENHKLRAKIFKRNMKKDEK